MGFLEGAGMFYRVSIVGLEFHLLRHLEVWVDECTDPRLRSCSCAKNIIDEIININRCISKKSLSHPLMKAN